MWDESTNVWDDPEFEEALGRYLPANVWYFRDPSERFFISFTDPFTRQEITVYLAPTTGGSRKCESCCKLTSCVLNEVLGALH